VWTDESRRLVLCDTPQRLKGALGGLLIEWETPTLRRPRSPRAASAPDRRRSRAAKLRCSVDEKERARVDEVLAAPGRIRRAVASRRGREDVFINEVAHECDVASPHGSRAFSAA